MENADLKPVKKYRSEPSYYQDGSARRRTEFTFYRGENANFYPSDDTFERDDAIPAYIVKGMMPTAPVIDRDTKIVAFGSCFASNISKYLDVRGYNVLTKKDDLSYVARMGDGIVNTYAVRQQFEWAWAKRTPEVEIWHGLDAASVGYDEEVRQRTQALFDSTDVSSLPSGCRKSGSTNLRARFFGGQFPLRNSIQPGTNSGWRRSKKTARTSRRFTPLFEATALNP